MKQRQLWSHLRRCVPVVKSEFVRVVDHCVSLKVQLQSVSAKHHVLLKQTQRSTRQGKWWPLVYVAHHLGSSLSSLVLLQPLRQTVDKTQLACLLKDSFCTWGLDCIAWVTRFGQDSLFLKKKRHWLHKFGIYYDEDQNNIFKGSRMIVVCFCLEWQMDCRLSFTASTQVKCGLMIS